MSEKRDKTVLIVDDSIIACRTLSRLLKPWVSRVIELQDSCSVMNTLEHEQIDCMILDLLMPVMDGKEVLRLVKETYPDLPVVIMSADIQHQTKTRCEELGAFAFLNKPSPEETLIQIVNEAMR